MESTVDKLKGSQEIFNQTNDFLSKIMEKKEDLFVERLKEMNLFSELETESGRRFKLFQREVFNNAFGISKERLWYNDGTDEGLFIIGFDYGFKTPDNFNRNTLGEYVFEVVYTL